MISVERSGMHDFDFLVGSWRVRNRRRNADGVWEEFAATTSVSQHVGGLVQLDRYDAPAFPGRGHVEAVTIRAFDATTRLWSLVWLSTYAPPDLSPVVGAWDGDHGEFVQELVDDDGRAQLLRFLWSRLGDDHAVWGQALSADDGATWDTNWTMEMTR